MDTDTQRINAWVNRLSITHSPVTVASYRWEVERFIKIRAVSVEKISGEDVIGYLADRRRDGIGESALKMCVCALRSFFKFCRSADTPMSGIPWPRPRRRCQRVLTPAQALAIMATCDTSTLIGVRNLSMLSLMLDTGMRAREVCRLAVKRVDLGGLSLSVICKGGEEKKKVYSQITGAYLARWLSVRDQIAAPSVETVFVSMMGGHRSGRYSSGQYGHPLTPSGLRLLFRSIGRAAGLSAFSPHDLRRTFVVLSLRAGSPTEFVKHAGGWERDEQVSEYAHTVGPEDIRPYLPLISLMR